MMRGKWWVALFLVSTSARASVMQPGGQAIPRPVSKLELDLVGQSFLWNAARQSYYDEDGVLLDVPLVFGEYYSPPAYPQFVDGDAITLGGLFKWRGEAIDWQVDATSPVGAFVPGCPLTVKPVLAGGTCTSPLFWYNVSDPSSKTPPSAAEMYELLPADLTSFLSCQAPLNQGFCPLAWDNRSPIDLSKKAWLPNQVTVDLTDDPRYLGGAIGFGLRRVASSYCGGSQFSVREHNARDAANRAYVGAIVYESRVDSGAIYLAFEDGAMPAADWTDGGKTDGDYNDYVAYVSGCFDQTPGGGTGGGGEAGAAGSAVGDTSGGVGAAGGARGDTTAGGAGGSRPREDGGASSSDAGHSEGGGDGDGASGQPANSGSGANSGDDGGCGCRLGSRDKLGAWGLLMPAASLGWLQLARRRRRTRQRTRA